MRFDEKAEKNLMLADTIRNRIQERLQDTHSGNDLNNMASALFRIQELELEIKDSFQMEETEPQEADKESVIFNQVLLLAFKEYGLIEDFIFTEDRKLYIQMDGAEINLLPLKANSIWNNLILRACNEIFKKE